MVQRLWVPLREGRYHIHPVLPRTSKIRAETGPGLSVSELKESAPRGG